MGAVIAPWKEIYMLIRIWAVVVQTNDRLSWGAAGVMITYYKNAWAGIDETGAERSVAREGRGEGCINIVKLVRVLMDAVSRV